MKNLLPPLLFCGALLCFVSCQDESDPAVPEVTEVPDIPFEALAPDDTLSLTETLRLQKPESIESAKIYLDNNLLSSLENAPFEYELDTRAHPDGEHDLRAEVKYAGNQEETFNLSVHIINTLATVNIPEGELEHADEIYLIASGTDGEIFGLTTVEGPGTYTIQAARKGFGSTVSLSLLAAGTSRFEEDEKFTDIRTVNGVPLQSQTEAYFYRAEFYDGEKGNAGIQVPDLDEQQVYFHQEQAYSGPSAISSRELTPFRLFADPSWLGVYKIDGDRYFYSLQQLNPQDELVLPLTEIDQTFIQKELSSSYYHAYELNLVPDPALYPQTSLHFWPLTNPWNGTPLEHYLSPSDPELAQELNFYRSEEENSSRLLSLYGTNPEPFVPDFVDILSASLHNDGEIRLTTSSSGYTYSLSNAFAYQEDMEIEWFVLSPPEMETYRLPDLSMIDSIAAFTSVPPTDEFELYDTYVFTYSEYPGLLDFIKKGILPDGIVYLSPGEYQYATLRYEADDEGGRKKRRKKAGLLRSAFAF